MDNSHQGATSLLVNDTWVVVAVNHYWSFERIFVIEAEFGDSIAMVGTPTSFEIHQEISCTPSDARYKSRKFGNVSFPGIAGVNSAMFAYE
jgi:hypothetical protein